MGKVAIGARIIVVTLAVAQMLFSDAQPPGGAMSRHLRSTVNPGTYVFYDWDNLSPAQYPWVTGGVIIRRWNHIAMGVNSYNWSQLETWIAREAGLGKRTILRVSPHDGWYQGSNLDGTPAWVYGEGVPQVRLA
ncbi:MAG: hypothetical protein Q8P59_14555, partial [Dehalococcoidia bacterium]|nr:hypothetical protein [Dehalococcoidia bacterium]